MSSIGLAIGIQNDLIGLQRDIERGEAFNYVLRLQSPSSDEKETRTSKAVELHNDAIRKAVDVWEDVKAEAQVGPPACTDTLLTFVERHYLWALTSKRYKCQQPEVKPSRLRASIGQLVMRATTAKTSMRKGGEINVQKSVASTTS